MRLPDPAPFFRSRPFLLTGLLVGAAAFALLTNATAYAAAQSQAEAEAEAEAMQAQSQAEAQKAAKHAAPPSALPGAETDSGDAEHARMDLNPTAALFDAINKGSIIAAKEALNRGADINARNVLDQTPLDMAIDLSRNDIMFLLLSLRAYNPDGRLTTEVHHEQIEQNGNGAGHLKIDGKTTSAPSPHAPKHVLASDGGRPQPQIGFLGFGH